MKGRKVLALFDFDGTITTRDSFIDFFEYHSGFFKFWLLAVATFPFSLGKVFGFVDPKFLKEIFLLRFIKGKNVEELNDFSLKYTKEKLPGILKKSALDEIARHKAEGNDIALVSASPTLWLSHFAKMNGMELISTRLEVKDGCYTGKIVGKNCIGAEKVRRIKEKYDISSYDEIYAYGDTKGDKEMLEIAHKKHFRHFS